MRLPSLFSFIIFLLCGLFCLPASAQPAANFSAGNTSICAPVIVQFTDQSSGSPVSWKWDFGNGNTSTDQNPGAFYTSPGVYTVTLVVSNAQGSDTLVKPYYIAAYSAPISNFSANDTAGCIPFSVNFFDQTIPLSNSIASWFWTFGDGGVSTQQNPSYTYTAPGTYDVSLIVVDANGCQDYYSRPSYIAVGEIKPDFSSYTSVCPAPADVFFTNTSKGTGLSFRWFFGDGDSSSASNPSHTYTSPGTYNVKLVISTASCSDSVTKQVDILNLQPDFSYSVNCSGKTFTLAFTDKTTPVPSSWSWSFGDGSTSTDQNPLHTYTSSQPYTITLITAMGGGCSDTVTKTYIPPLPAFFADSFVCQSPFTVSFNNQSAGTDSVTYTWAFGDGTTSSAAAPTHTYTVAPDVLIDTFTVTLTATNKFGCKSGITKDISLWKPFARYTADLTSGCKPFLTSFTDKSISQDPVVAWQWDFGDGQVSSQQNPQHTYIDTGRYTVSLIVTTAKGCKDTITGQNYIKVGILPDYIDFITAFGDTACFHNMYQYLDKSGFNDTSIHVNNWRWDFVYDTITKKSVGDTAFDQNPFFDTGHWPMGYVTMQFVAGYNGCNDTIRKTFPNVPPRTDLAYFHTDSSIAGKEDLTACAPPITLGFSNNSSNYESVVSFYVVHIETNQTTNLDGNPSAINYITFNRAGHYQFYLTTYNSSTKSGGCTDGNPHYMVVIDSVHTGFTSSQQAACLASNTFNFSDTSKSFYGEIRRWRWDFGDGDTLANDTITEVVNYFDTVPRAMFGTDTVQPVHSNGGYTSGSYKSPAHTYRDTGTYIIKEQITVDLMYWCCGDGKYDTSHCTYTNYDTIVVNNAYSLFSVNKTYGCKPLSIAFSDSSRPYITKRYWDFGDGSPIDSSSQNPVHIYTDTGRYDVALIVHNAKGCIDTLVMDDLITVVHPTADFSVVSASVCEGATAVFKDLSAGNNISYLWNFGDGDTASAAAPVHIYSTSGTYTVNLIVTDSSACRDTMTQPAFITVNALPAGAFKTDTLFGACPPSPISFTDLTSPPGISKWEWDFGDSVTSSLQNPVHYYTVSGDFSVKLITTSSNGCTDTVTKNSLVKIAGPRGTFSFTPDTSCIPFTATFKATAINADLYYWDFGDGSVLFLSSAGKGDSVIHTYTTPGAFTPNLILHDTAGCIYTVPSSDTIYADGALPDFRFGDTLRCDNDSILFDNLTEHLFPVTYLWNFGDGDTSTSAYPVHKFLNSGTYSVTLSALTSLGCPSAAFSKKVVVHKAPDLEIIADSMKCDAPLKISFSFQNKDTSVIVSSVNWEFGDSASASGNTVSHTYAAPGPYDVKLTYTYAGGDCVRDSIIHLNAYYLPQAQFAYTPVYPTIGNSTINFVSQSVSASYLLWHFGNGDSSLQQNPSYTYPAQSGEYEVQLVAVNGGCSDTASATIYISSKAFVRLPTAFTPNGDGTNDKINILYAGIGSLVAFKIFNRWGQMVYETQNINDGWDGTYNGVLQDTDTYSYYILAKAADSDQTILQKGVFTLIR